MAGSTAARAALPRHIAAGLEDFATRVRDRFGDRLAVLRLFGSYARGDWDEESDVDVVVVVDGLERAERREVSDLATEVHLERCVPISPLVLSRDEHELLVRREYLIAQDLEREGIALLTEDNRRANLQVELEKGEESLRAAEVCLGAGLWNDAVSRAYYGAFHHVQAVLFSAGLEARKHAGVHDLFYLRFVREGTAPGHLAKLFAGLRNGREQADYARPFRFTEEDAREEVEHAREIGAWARGHLERSGWLAPSPSSPPQT